MPTPEPVTLSPDVVPAPAPAPAPAPPRVLSTPSGPSPRVATRRNGPVVWAVVTTVVVLVVAGLVGWDRWAATASGAPPAATDAPGRPRIGHPAPDLSATLVTGQPVSLSALRGHPVWLTFGATWCAECRVEAPDVAEQAARWRPDGLVVLAIYLGDDEAAVRDFATRLHLDYLHATDPGRRIAARYRVTGIPMHYFIDAEGIVRAADVGVLTPQEMSAEVRRVLPAAPG